MSYQQPFSSPGQLYARPPQQQQQQPQNRYHSPGPQYSIPVAASPGTTYAQQRNPFPQQQRGPQPQNPGYYVPPTASFQQQPQSTGYNYQPNEYKQFNPAENAFPGPQQIQPQQPGVGQGPIGPMGSMGPMEFNNFSIGDLQTNAAAQLGMQFGGAAIKQGTEYMNQNINRYVSLKQLRYYFNVSNSYVLTKIRMLLFPFRQRQWLRLAKREEHSGQVAGYQPPREDLNAPDLYIPVMAYVTYVLLVGMILGAKNEFKPEVLGITSSTAFFVILIEVLFLKFGAYLLSVTGEVPFLDLIAYTGYKFIGVITTLLIKLLIIRFKLVKMYWVMWTVFVYCMMAFGLFTLRSLKYIVIPDSTNSAHTVQTPMRRRRVHFLFVVAIIQIFFSWLMV